MVDAPSRTWRDEQTTACDRTIRDGGRPGHAADIRGPRFGDVVFGGGVAPPAFARRSGQWAPLEGWSSMTCWNVGRFVVRIVSGMRPGVNPVRDAALSHMLGSAP